MKRVYFLSSVMFIVLSSFAQQVTRQEAVNAAVNTMKYNGRTNTWPNLPYQVSILEIMVTRS